MQTASISEIRKELNNLPAEALRTMCLRLAAYKKDNKELLTYLLFEADNEQAFVRNVKEEVSGLVEGMNKSSLYLAKKTIRKILRVVNRSIAYSQNAETKVELLIFFCESIKRTGLPIHESPVLLNLYRRQQDAISKALAQLHEDLRFDYSTRIAALTF